MKRLIAGQPLYTKDEFVFSNASVLCVGSSGRFVTYQIKSVHGNIGVLNETEVEQSFNLESLHEEATEPFVSDTSDGFVLTVGLSHAENIKMIVPSQLYTYEENNQKNGVFNVSYTNWQRFSEMLCL